MTLWERLVDEEGTRENPLVSWLYGGWIKKDNRPPRVS